ncbi:MAG: hypothetical protein QGG31_02840, partial [Anaerolineales bacterium]|nr:hypothetical protein [Anaerolineales bacterium]
IWMELLSRVDPVTYGVDPLRQVALRAVVPAQFMDAIALRPMMVNVMMMVTFAIVFLVPAVWLFGRQD